MMTRFSAATISVAPTGTASVAELMRPPPDLCVANRVPKDQKGVCYRPQLERTALAKSCRLCSTRKESFSNARDSGLFIALMAPLFFADHLRDCPQSGRECGRRLVARPGQHDLHDFLHGSGTIRHHDHAVGEQQRLFDAMRHEHDGLLELCPDAQQ